MIDTPKDLTAPEHVERFFDPVECALDPQGSSAAIRALSAALVSVCKREAAMYARYDAKLDAAEAELAHHRDLDQIMREEGADVEGCLRAELRQAETERDAALGENARLQALLDAHDAWARGEPSRPPRAALNKGRAP